MFKYSKKSDVWGCFDRIYCISVENRFDRRHEAEKQFESIGLKGRVEFFIVKKHPVDSAQGIFESHIRCMEKGLAENARSMVIFEDDVVFDRFDASRLRKGVEFMDSLTKWDILFFGCLFSQPVRTDCESVLKIRYRSLTHGYLISRDFARVVCRKAWEGVSYDEMLRNIRGHYHTIHPTFAFQSNSITDNDKYLQLDRFRRLIGGLRRIQKMNEFFYLNKTVIIAVHTLFLGLFFGILLVR